MGLTFGLCAPAMIMTRILVSGALYLGVFLGLASGQNCAEDKVRKCIAIAEPMLKDPHMIFPDNMNDINSVCRTWANFVDCIQRYIDKCFSKSRKDQFNSAVEPPIASVHQMCSVSAYQSEYLNYAGCIKSTVIEPQHCGGHYSLLVGEVSQENVRKGNLCCAYHNFRSCVITKTRMGCDRDKPDGIAAKFSRQVLDKAFRFLQDQCINYVPDTGKCAALMTSNKSAALSISRLGEGRSVVLDGPGRSGSRKSPTIGVYQGKASDVYDTVTNTAQSTNYDSVGRMPNYTTNLDSRSSVASSQSVTSAPPSIARQNSKSNIKVNDEKPEEGSNRKAEPTHYTPIVENSVPVATATQRSSSYGRGISWTTPSTTSTSEIPDWATNTWLTHGQKLPENEIIPVLAIPVKKRRTALEDLTTEEIYPEAGSFGGNNIDEPNQQGLSRNVAAAMDAPSTAMIFLLSALCALRFAD